MRLSVVHMFDSQLGDSNYRRAYRGCQTHAQAGETSCLRVVESLKIYFRFLVILMRSLA